MISTCLLDPVGTVFQLPARKQCVEKMPRVLLYSNGHLHCQFCDSLMVFLMGRIILPPANHITPLEKQGNS